MRSSKKTLTGLAVLLLLFGVAIYLKLWSIDYSIASDEAELLRRQFDLANREAMDESAEWRLKYDVEAERATKCMKQLKQIQGSSQEGSGDDASFNQKLANLQKENKALVKQMKALKQELEAEKLKCSLQ